MLSSSKRFADRYFDLMFNLHTLANSEDIDCSNYIRKKAQKYMECIHELKRKSYLTCFRLLRWFPISRRDFNKLELFAAQNALD